jgi:DNA polymerase IV (archaeal DinB-like DNA polymerase)
MKVVMHVDLNAFFAAVEERERPELKGKPIVVGAPVKEGQGRGIVNTSSYSARQFGIHSGMPVSEAYKLCPQAFFIKPNFELYEKVSQNVMEILKDYADKFEQGGIDEAFLDVSSYGFDGAVNVANLIKEKIFETEGITCSIGIAPNKIIAKMASDFRKPDGLTVVNDEDAKKFLFPLPVEKLLGIGRKTKAKMEDMDIKTIGDLANYRIQTLEKRFGVVGFYFHQIANGIDDSEVATYSERKSFGREVTFEKDVDDNERILKTAEALADQVIEDSKGFSFRTVTVKVRYENFETHTISKTLSVITNSSENLKFFAKQLLIPFIGKDKIRLIGIRISNLFSMEKQKTLLEIN